MLTKALHLVTYALQRIISQDYKSAIITSSGTFIMPQLARNFHEIFIFNSSAQYMTNKVVQYQLLMFLTQP